MSRRSRARLVAFQVLFQDDLNPHGSVTWRDQMIKDELKQDDLVELARELVSGVRKHREALDAALGRIAQNWSLTRMAATDRNILRLATFEMLHRDTPHRVVINEAINLAKQFGTGESAQFVNGILDRLIPGNVKPQESSAASPATSEAEPAAEQADGPP